VNKDFLRVTTIPLEARFMQKLDKKCSELIQVVRKKGGAIREKIKLLPIVETDTDTTTKREIALKCLIFNMGESVEDLIKEFLVSEKEEAGQILQQETISIFVIRDAQAAPKDIGIILEGQEKVFMELDPEGMPTKVKKLYDQLYNRAWFRTGSPDQL
ncbi:Cysteine synthase, partial [Dissostichus eleginoides]